MASPLRSAGPAPRRGRTTGLEVIPTSGRASTAARAPAGRLRVAAAPELVADDDHPDFHQLPTYRGRS